MEGSIKDLSKYRFENSIEALEDAKLLFENGRYKSALLQIGSVTIGRMR